MLIQTMCDVTRLCPHNYFSLCRLRLFPRKLSLHWVVLIYVLQQGAELRWMNRWQRSHEDSCVCIAKCPCCCVVCASGSKRCCAAAEWCREVLQKGISLGVPVSVVKNVGELQGMCKSAWLDASNFAFKAVLEIRVLKSLASKVWTESDNKYAFTQSSNGHDDTF